MTFEECVVKVINEIDIPKMQYIRYTEGETTVYLEGEYSMLNALILREFSQDEILRIKKAAEGRCTVTIAQPDWTREQLIEAYQRADIISGDPEPKDLKYCTSLKWMQSSCDGVAHFVDTGRFNSQCLLTNMAGVQKQVISEFVMGAIISLCHCFPAYLEQMKDGLWQHMAYHKTLENATVLILGAGSIGGDVARKLRAFDCKIIGMRRTKRDCPPEYDEMISLTQLDEYLPQADVIVCCLPGTKETSGLLGKERLLRMKKDAILVNVGRGNLIPEDDLNAVMSEGHFWGVALDVTDVEPLPKEHPLWKQKNLILTPHVAGNCFREDSPTLLRIHEVMLQNFENYLDGKPHRNIIDYKNGYRTL